MDAQAVATPNPSEERYVRRVAAIKLQERFKEVDENGYTKLGVLYDEVALPSGEKQAVLHIGDPYQPGFIQFVTIPTRASREEIEQIRNSIIAMPETCQMLSELAQSYAAKEPFIMEGDTSIGKTYIVNKFYEMLYGIGRKPEDFYCSGHTDVSEIMGKYIPWTENPRAQRIVTEFQESEEGVRLINQWRTSGAFGELKTNEEIREAIARHLNLPGKQPWNFQYGVLPRAFVCHVEADGTRAIHEEPGPGTVLHVQELGLAHPAVANAFFLVRGKDATITTGFQLPQDGGRTIGRGENAFIVFSTNPAEVAGFEFRTGIDIALVRGCRFLRMDKLSDTSMGMAVDQKFKKAFSSLRDASCCYFDISESPELAKQLIEIVTAFHLAYSEELKGGEKNGRTQKIPVTLDDISRLARYVVTNQVVDLSTGRADIALTLEQGVKSLYLNRLSDPKLIGKFKDLIHNELNDTALSNLKLRGEPISRADYWRHLIEAHEAAEGDAKPEAANPMEELQREMLRTIIVENVNKILAHIDGRGELTEELKGIFVKTIDLASDESKILKEVREALNAKKSAPRRQLAQALDTLTSAGKR